MTPLHARRTTLEPTVLRRILRSDRQVLEPQLIRLWKVLKTKLEQLERLRSETNFKKCKKNEFKILQETLHATHRLKLLDKMYKYEMDPTKTVGATERTRGAGQTDGQTDGRTEWNQYTPNNFVVRWVKLCSCYHLWPVDVLVTMPSHFLNQCWQ